MLNKKTKLIQKAFASLIIAVGSASVASGQKLEIHWEKPDRISKTSATLQVVVNPPLRPGSRIAAPAYANVKRLGADYVRYVPWLPYPKLGVAELEPPSDGKTSWNFSLIDPMTIDFLKATAGHPVILNFSTIPAWLLKLRSLLPIRKTPTK